MDPAKELGRLEELLLLKRLEHRRAKDWIEGARSFKVLLRFSPVVAVAGDGTGVVESRGSVVTIIGTVDCSLEEAVRACVDVDGLSVFADTIFFADSFESLLKRRRNLQSMADNVVSVSVVGDFLPFFLRLG